ncbi:hypothetical protein F5X96DRAFT_451763 [Biscogniauxia mediterranea]|nr:hypothetical protein F5X96DRAFT_451763 [Biscogniauxia mediterranea]
MGDRPNNEPEAATDNGPNGDDISPNDSLFNFPGSHETPEGLQDMVRGLPSRTALATGNTVESFPSLYDRMGKIFDVISSCDQSFSQRHPTNATATNDNNHHLYNVDSLESPLKRGGKRRGSNTGSERIERQRPRLDQGCEGNDNMNSRSFACPFYKSNSNKYSDCRTNILTRIKDVKQHVYRKHSKPHLYCPLCFEVFTKAKSRDNHIRQETCVPQRDPGYDGISEDQKESLREKSVRGKPVEEQWRDVWYIIFPGATPPESPYLQSYREEVASTIRSFWDENKDQVISETIKTVPVTRSLLDKGMDTLIMLFETRMALPYRETSLQDSQTNYMAGYKSLQWGTQGPNSYASCTSPPSILEQSNPTLTDSYENALSTSIDMDMDSFLSYEFEMGGHEMRPASGS